ncbi:hypothetical protein AB0C87_22755 [Actinomadura sp. NPDC048021]|uniref:hypothetical protein n=1 Tax=Actinomadura sp. NPDC048021 TaxID=3155385 RepID=UPI00340AE333
MNHEKTKRVVALDAALNNLAVALSSKDEQAIWDEIQTALMWLYQLQEIERQNDQGYYSHQRSIPEGQCLAGLIWVRGLATHRQASVREKMFKRVGVHVLSQGELKEVQVSRMTDGKLQPISVNQLVARWPELNQLPATPSDTYGREAFYAQHVAGKDTLAPLKLAREYLVAKRP